MGGIIPLALAAKSEDESWSPRTHMVGEKQLWQLYPLTSVHVSKCKHVHVRAHTNTHVN